MNYEIYIDESGTINQLKMGIFEVAFLIIRKDERKKTERFFKNKILNFKKQNGISIDVELKAHYLKKNNFLDFIDNTFHNFLAHHRVISAYIDNRSLMSNSNQTDQRFYRMIGLIIERCKDRKYISDGDEIEIFADQRNNLVSEIIDLKNKSDTIHNIKITKFTFKDSSKNTLIQIADIISFKCNRIIIDSLKTGNQITSIKNLSFRKIFY